MLSQYVGDNGALVCLVAAAVVGVFGLYLSFWEMEPGAPGFVPLLSASILVTAGSLIGIMLLTYTEIRYHLSPVFSKDAE
jgi:hypothetical protein